MCTLGCDKYSELNTALQTDVNQVLNLNSTSIITTIFLQGLCAEAVK